jgi:hypothetical protein
MAKVVIYLRDTELSALNKLAQREYRVAKAQAALIIRQELERLGMISADQNEGARLQCKNPVAAQENGGAQ